MFGVIFVSQLPEIHPFLLFWIVNAVFLVLCFRRIQRGRFPQVPVGAFLRGCWIRVLAQTLRECHFVCSIAEIFFFVRDPNQGGVLLERVTTKAFSRAVFKNYF